MRARFGPAKLDRGLGDRPDRRCRAASLGPSAPDPASRVAARSSAWAAASSSLAASATTRSFGPAPATAFDRRPAAAKDLQVGRRGHDQAGAIDAGDGFELGGDLHQLDRVPVAVRETAGVNGRHQPAPPSGLAGDVQAEQDAQ